MAVYRVSRCIEASLIDFLQSAFTVANWTGITIEKSYTRAYTLAMNSNTGATVVCVRASDTNRKRFQIGTDDLLRSQLVLIDVFATSDGQRLDLVDFIVDSLKSGFVFYNYVTNGNATPTKTANGRCTIQSFEDTPVNFGVDKSGLEVQDRYRHLISLVISTGKVE